MTVSVTISGQSQGVPMEEITDLGQHDPKSASDAVNLYIRHNASVYQITDCAFYIVRYVGAQYTGTETPEEDFDTVLSWGDAAIATYPEDAHGVTEERPECGGFYLSMNHASGFPENSWHPFYAGYGDRPEDAIELSEDAINIEGPSWSSTNGEIPFQGEAHVRVRWDIPQSASDAGIKFIQLVMAYSYTS